MKRLLILLCLCLFASGAFAQGMAVTAAGLSFTTEAKDPAMSILMGSQLPIDRSKDLWLRTTFNKVNWGSDSYDNIGLQTIMYWNLPFGQSLFTTDPFKIGWKFAGEYQPADADIGAATGIEVLKSFFMQTVFVFAGIDIIWQEDVRQEYYTVTAVDTTFGDIKISIMSIATSGSETTT